jgi:hypothetical protein
MGKITIFLPRVLTPRFRASSNAAVSALGTSLKRFVRAARAVVFFLFVAAMVPPG